MAGYSQSMFGREMTPFLGPQPILSRQDIARRELEAAIRNLFIHEDLIAAHLLAWAALDVISDVSRSTGKATLRNGMTQKMPREFLLSWKKAERDHYNFLKHADRDPTRKIRLIPQMTFFVVHIACRDYLSVFEHNTPSMAIYTGWYMTQNPEMALAMASEYRAVIDEAFGNTSELAWSAAKEMLETADANPGAFSA